jgi:hypothetical protein
MDGTLNESGSITEVVDLILRYNGHTERALFCVTGLGKQKLIIGYTWFRDHNPEVNWETGEVKMSRCKPSSRCFGCKKELNEEKKAARKEEAKVNACRSGPAPSLTPEESSPEDSDDLESSDLPFDLEEGDHVWVSLRKLKSISTLLQPSVNTWLKVSCVTLLLNQNRPLSLLHLIVLSLTIRVSSIVSSLKLSFLSFLREDLGIMQLSSFLEPNPRDARFTH